MTAVSGVGSSYVVTVSGIPGVGSGIVGLNVVNAGSIVDSFGNPLDATAAIPVAQQFTICRQLYWDGSARRKNVWSASSTTWHVGSPTGPAT